MQFPEETIELLSQFKEVAVGGSLDAIGPALEFIRNGSRDQVVKQNLLRLVQRGQPFKVNLSVTYMALNALELFDLFEFIKGPAFENRVCVNIDILYEPSHLSVKNLPDQAKVKALAVIKRIHEEFHKVLSQEEKRNLDSLYRYLETCEKGDPKSLVKYNDWLDELHGKKMKDFLPRLYKELSGA
jgi:MoaA/NifB/PqqE/SkfB family radical SAM enzyme